jgi:RHS repeat-associated protein
LWLKIYVVQFFCPSRYVIPKDESDNVNGGGFCCDNKVLKAGAIGNGNDNPELFQYYYHSDHLGSSSLITNLDGEIVQHIEYVPFGEVFIEERNNTWNTPYLFNAKELDEETGLYYYGARYYDPRTSIWLSTDPLQEKYPSISPYVYCAQNPVKLVDPDGKDLVITGERIKTAFNALQKSYNKGITLTFDSNTNYVYATRNEGVELSQEEEILYNIITSRNIEVRLETYTNDRTSDGIGIAFGGAFLGNTLYQDGTGQTKALARQAVCVPEMEMAEKAYGQTGILYLHEISEAYEGGKNSIASGIAAKPAIQTEAKSPNSDYMKAHTAATPQPRIERNPNTGDIYIEYKKRGVNANGRTDNRIMTFLKNKPTTEGLLQSIIKPIKFK